MLESQKQLELLSHAGLFIALHHSDVSISVIRVEAKQKLGLSGY